MFSKVRKRYHKLLKRSSYSHLYLQQLRSPKKFLYCMSSNNYRYVENSKTKVSFLETIKGYQQGWTWTSRLHRGGTMSVPKGG